MVFPIDYQDLPIADPIIHEAYSRMVPLKFQCCLVGQNPWNITTARVIVIGATSQNQPVGLIIASQFTFLLSAEIHWLFVNEAHRNQKIATQLVLSLEKELKQLNCPIITLAYETDTPSAPALENVLLHTKWPDPVVFVQRYFFDVLTFNPAWFQKSYKFPSNVVTFPWTELKPKDKVWLKDLVQQYHFLALLSPFYEEERIEPLNSMGIRFQGEVIGWMITHRIAPDTIRYTSLYIMPKFQLKGSSTPLLIQSINLQKKMGIPQAFFEINFSQLDQRWQKFVNQRLAPYAKKITQVKQVSKLEL